LNRLPSSVSDRNFPIDGVRDTIGNPSKPRHSTLSLPLPSLPPHDHPRSALNFDLFAEASHKRKIDEAGDPLQTIAQHIGFAELAGLLDAIVGRAEARRGGRPAYLTEVMVRVLVVKRQYNLWDEQMEY